MIMPQILPFLLVAITAILSGEVSSSPPGPVVTCRNNISNTNCTVTNSYGTFPDRTTCRVATVAYPNNQTELLAVVSAAAMRKQKMKAVTIYAHSIPKLSCPGGLSGAGLAISTARLNRTVRVDAAARRLTVQAGMSLKGLIDASAGYGLAVPYTPYWQGMTLGGLLATGSHGSSLFGKGSAVHEYVVGVRMVVPTAVPAAGGYYAKVVELSEGDEDLLAAKVSLGVLGVIFEVTLQLEPMFKRSISNRVVADTNFESTIQSFGATTQHGDITWYPSQRRVVYRDDVRVPVTTPGNGENDFTGFQPQLSLIIGATRALEESLEATSNVGGKCLQSRVQVTTLLETGSGLKNRNGILLDFTGYPVIGNNSRMQSSGSCLRSNEDALLTACAWDPRIDGLFYHQTTISIALSNATSFLVNVKKLRDMNPQSLCGTELYSGFLMRYVRNSTAYLGKTEDCLDIDVTYYRSHDPNKARLNEDVLEEIEQMALFKYQGLPHWGKNRNVGFLGMSQKYGAKMGKFVEVMKRFDPDGLFSSEWSDAMLGLDTASLIIEKKGCALEGLCVCSSDQHCAPEQGYFCRPGLVYQQARVCRRVNNSNPLGSMSI